MVTAYENTSNNYYKTTTEVTCKGEKSFCIYCDNNASENETTVIKQLPPKSMTCVIILKYSNSSIFSCSSTIQASTEKEAKAEESKNNININNNINIPKNNNNVHPVFNMEGEPIDDDGYLVQYLMELGNESYVVGLENKSNYGFKLRINLEGLDIVDGNYQGNSKPIFTINPLEKKIFNIKVKNNYYGNVSFQFEYA